MSSKILLISMKKIDIQDLTLATKTSASYAEVLKKLNLKQSGSMQSRIKKEIKNLELDISHFTGQAWCRGKTILDDSRLEKKNGTDVFIEKSKFSKSYVRNLVKKKNLIEYKCQLCNNSGLWLNQKLTLQLDHINGNSTDQRLENLRFLCPNCHSQTDTFCAKNKKYSSTKKIKDDVLIDMYHKCKGNINQTLKNLGIDNGRNYSRLYKLIESKILNG